MSGVNKGHWKRLTTSLVSAFFHWVKKANFRGVSVNGKQWMAEVVESTKWLNPETIRRAKTNARDKANAARWNLEVAVLSFATLIIVMILLFQGVGVEIIAVAAVAGLAMVWFAGWSRGNKLYERFYDEELTQLRQELETTVKEAVEETVDEKVRKALRERQR